MYTDKELCRHEKETGRKSSCAAFSIKEAVFTKYCSDATSLQHATILPILCLICKKVAKRAKIKGNWVHETLSKAETSDASKVEIKRP